MRNVLVGLAVVGILVGLSATAALSYRSGKSGGEGDFAIYVAPATVVRTAPGDAVTIHTNVPLEGVTPGSVAVDVDGTPVTVTTVYADDRGQLVARVLADAVIEAATANTATITLTLAVGADTQSACDVVRVKG